jgi:hypothetical protein
MMVFRGLASPASVNIFGINSDMSQSCSQMSNGDAWIWRMTLLEDSINLHPKYIFMTMTRECIYKGWRSSLLPALSFLNIRLATI